MVEEGKAIISAQLIQSEHHCTIAADAMYNHDTKERIEKEKKIDTYS